MAPSVSSLVETLTILCLGPTSGQSWRRLGSFERLLTRKAASGGRMSIPHICVALVEGPLDASTLFQSLVRVVCRHPLLRACIRGTSRVEDAPVVGVRAGEREEAVQVTGGTRRDEYPLQSRNESPQRSAHADFRTAPSLAEAYI